MIHLFLFWEMKWYEMEKNAKLVAGDKKYWALPKKHGLRLHSPFSPGSQNSNSPPSHIAEIECRACLRKPRNTPRLDLSVSRPYTPNIIYPIYTFWPTSGKTSSSAVAAESQASLQSQLLLKFEINVSLVGFCIGGMFHQATSVLLPNNSSVWCWVIDCSRA